MLGGVQSGLRRPAYQVSSAGSVIAAPRRPAARLMITKTSSMIGLVKGAMDLERCIGGIGLAQCPSRCHANTAAARLRQSTSRAGSTGICSTPVTRSEEHTSELQSLMRISYAVFCLKKKKTKKI